MNKIISHYDLIEKLLHDIDNVIENMTDYPLKNDQKGWFCVRADKVIVAPCKVNVGGLIAPMNSSFYSSLDAIKFLLDHLKNLYEKVSTLRDHLVKMEKNIDDYSYIYAQLVQNDENEKS